MSHEELMARLIEQRPQFLAFLTRRLRNADAAEDVLQEAYARGVDQLETVRDESAVVAWFYRVLRNGAADYQRRTGASQRAVSALEHELDTSSDPEHSVTPCTCVTTLSTALKPEYASALTRVEVDGVLVKDFAREQGISPENAAVRVFRARRALKHRVIECCGACADDGCQDCTCHAEKSVKSP